MPKAPEYQPATTGVEPVTARLQAPQGSGGIIAEALGNAAEQLRQFGEAKARRDELAARAESGEAALSFQDQAGGIMAEATASRGLNAQPAHKAADEALLKAQEKLMAGAKSPRVKELIRQQTNAYLVGYRADLAKHESTEVFNAATDTMGAQADAARETAAQQWMNPTAVQAQVQIGRDAIQQKGSLLGKSEQDISLDVHDYESGTYRSIVEKLYAGGNNDAALIFAKANIDRMNVGDQTAIMGMLKATAQNREAADDAAWATGQGGPVPVAAPGAKFTPPVRNGHITDGYGVPRPGGRAHNGVDFAAPEGTSVTPVASGTVVATGQDPRSGKYVIVDHGGGLISTYSHLGRQDVKGGDKVGPDTALGPVGLTGHTTGPHTHVVMRLNGKPVDPMQYIGQSAPSASAAGHWDKGSAYAAIDKRADWSFERKERAKAKVDEEFARKDSIQARAEREADDEAKRVVIGLGDRFTSFNQIPKNVRDAMSIEAVGRFMDAARAKSDAAARKAQEQTSLSATLRMYNDPQGFMNADVAKDYLGKVSQSDFARIATDQARMRQEASKPRPWDPYRETANALNQFSNFNGVKLRDDEKATVLQTMKAQADDFVSRNHKPPSSSDWYDFARRATRSVSTPGMLWGTNETPLYRAAPTSDQRKAVVDTFRRVYKRDPSDEEVLYWFRQQQAGAPVQ